MTRTELNAKRVAAALPRWKKILDWKKSGLKYREIGEKLGISLWQAFKLHCKAQDARLKNWI